MSKKVTVVSAIEARVKLTVWLFNDAGEDLDKIGESQYIGFAEFDKKKMYEVVHSVLSNAYEDLIIDSKPSRNDNSDLDYDFSATISGSGTKIMGLITLEIEEKLIDKVKNAANAAISGSIGLDSGSDFFYDFKDFMKSVGITFIEDIMNEEGASDFCSGYFVPSSNGSKANKIVESYKKKIKELESKEKLTEEEEKEYEHTGRNVVNDLDSLNGFWFGVDYKHIDKKDVNTLRKPLAKLGIKMTIKGDSVIFSNESTALFPEGQKVNNSGKGVAGAGRMKDIDSDIREAFKDVEAEDIRDLCEDIVPINTYDPDINQAEKDELLNIVIEHVFSLLKDGSIKTVSEFLKEVKESDNYNLGKIKIDEATASISPKIDTMGKDFEKAVKKAGKNPTTFSWSKTKKAINKLDVSDLDHIVNVELMSEISGDLLDNFPEVVKYIENAYEEAMEAEDTAEGSKYGDVKGQEPADKDIQRIKDLETKAKGDEAKMLKLAQNMANTLGVSPDSVDKAIRRAKACEIVYKGELGEKMAKIFMDIVVNQKSVANKAMGKLDKDKVSKLLTTAWNNLVDLKAHLSTNKDDTYVNVEKSQKELYPVMDKFVHSKVESVAETKNEIYGFYGTSKTCFNLNDKEATELFAKAEKILAKKLEVTEKIAGAVLDFKDGRYLAEEMTYLVSKDKRPSMKSLMEALDKASDKILKNLKKLVKENMEDLEDYISTTSSTSLNPKEQKRYDTIKEIVDEGQYEKIDGVIIDGTTANMLLKILDNLNEENKKKMLSMPIKKMVDVSWKLVK